MKKILVLLLALMMVFVFASCAQQSDTPAGNTDTDNTADNSSSDNGEVYTMRIATLTTDDCNCHEMANLAARVEENSNGRIVVEQYPSAQLGSNSQLLQGILAGTVSCLIEPSAFMGGFCNTVTVLDLPYLFEDVWQAADIVNGPAGDPLRAYLEEQGVVAGAFFPYGPRILLMRDEVRTLDDFKGKKIRVMGAEVLQDEMAAWGAAGVPMDATEVYTALSNGTIDGLGSSYMFFYQGKFFEAAKYIFDEPKAAELSICALSKAWLDTLPTDLQQVVKDSCKEAIPLSLDYEQNAATEAIDLMEAEGVTLIQLTDEERQAFIDASMSVHQTFLEKNPEAVDIYNTIVDEVAKGK